MAALPEIDTYGVLGRFAREPYRYSNILALRLLKHRAMSMVAWRSLTLNNAGRNMDDVLNLAFGAYAADTAEMGSVEQTVMNIANMSKEDQRAAYEQLLKSQGYNIDMKDVDEHARKLREAKAAKPGAKSKT